MYTAFLLALLLAADKPLDPLVKLLASTTDAAVQKDILQGMTDALAGRRAVTAPKGWSGVHRTLSTSKDGKVREMVLRLSVLFGDPQALAALKKTALDTRADKGQRERALATLIDRRPEGVAKLLRTLLDDKTLRRPALRGLAGFADDETPKEIFKRYKSFTAAEKTDAVGTLASRPAFALVLLEAVQKKQIPPGDISAFAARQLADLKDRKVSDLLAKVWGNVRPTAKEKTTLLAKYSKLATPNKLKNANRVNGRVVYAKLCANCHMLFNAGGKIGPDLTGSQRAKPEYILTKVLDPNAVVPLTYQVTRLVLKSGRIVTGLIASEQEKVMVIQTATDQVRINKADIEKRDRQPVSLMPEGQFKDLTDTQIRDLLAYLAGKDQVDLPATPRGPKGSAGAKGAKGPTRPRHKQETPKGTRHKLSMGTLFLPAGLPQTGKIPLQVHFHGAGWIAEVAGAKQNRAVLSVQLGEGSAVYAKPFADSKKFGALLAEAEKKSKRQFSSVGLSSWSAGYGASRAILKVPGYYKRVSWVVLLDGMHASYAGKKGDPIEKRIKADDVDIFVTFARDAAASKKKMVILHSSIVTPYASTTETADYTLAKLGLKRKSITGAGRFGLPQKTEAHKGKLWIVGCGGTIAADHVDQLHALPAVMKLLDGK